MYRKKTEEDIRCPLEYGMNLLGGKWKSRIVCLIGNKGPQRFGELKSDLVNITDGVLANTLTELTESGMIEKNSHPGQMANDYCLTEKGKSVLPLLQKLCQWSAPYYKKIMVLSWGIANSVNFIRISWHCFCLC